MGSASEIDVISCYVDLSQEGNNSLFDREAIHKEIAQAIIPIFEKYHVRYKIEDLSGLGGGGNGPSWWELIQMAWSQKQLIGVVTTLWSLGSTLIWHFHNWMSKFSQKYKPRVDIVLSLTHTKPEDIFTEDVNALTARLLNLKRLNDEICDFLSEKYKVFAFDQQISATVLTDVNPFENRKYFNISYNTKHEARNSFNHGRLVRIIKSLKIRNSYSQSYNFSGNFFIKRYDVYRDLTIKNPAYQQQSREYYLFISTKVLKDYF